MFMNVARRVSSVCEIVALVLMSDAGVLSVRRGATREKHREIAGN